MTQASHELVVVGGGPAGYAAAIRAAQLGMQVACVDDRSSAGGTCLHVGCIPSKALLSSSERLARARLEWPEHGIGVGEPTIDLDTLMGRKRSVVDRLTRGVDGLLEKQGVERLHGRGELLGGTRLRVVDEDGGEREIEGRHLLLATGSIPTLLPGLPEDSERILTSTEALALPSVPERLAVVGGGYIGLELGSVWARLGAEVTVLELEDRLLPGMDPELAEQLAPLLEEQGLELRLGCGVDEIALAGDDEVVLRLSTAGDDGTEELRCSHVLVAVGREPATRGLGLEAAGVELDDDGFVRTDRRFRSTAPGILAVGDLAGEPMLAHKGLLEGVACVEALAGRGSGHVDYASVPAVVYTWPEVASVGASETELREAGIRYRSGRASFEHDSRALCTGEAQGFVKLLVEEEGDRLLGAHLLGPQAGTLIHELVLTRAFGASVEELGRAAHAHPTCNESIREAALDAYGRAIHH